MNFTSALDEKCGHIKALSDAGQILCGLTNTLAEQLDNLEHAVQNLRDKSNAEAFDLVEKRIRRVRELRSAMELGSLSFTVAALVEIENAKLP